MTKTSTSSSKGSDGGGQTKKAPAQWTSAKESILVDAYTQEIIDCASPKGLNTASWRKVVNAFNKKANDNLDAQQLQNKIVVVVIPKG